MDSYEVYTKFTELDGRRFVTRDESPRLAYDPRNKLRQVSRFGKNWQVSAPGKFYLAGPMRGYELSNFPRFLMAAKILTARGIEVVSPAEKDIEAGFDPSRPVEKQDFNLAEAFRWDFKAMADCRGIILLPGWEASEGTKAERVVAELCGRAVYELDDQYVLHHAKPATYELTWKHDESAVLRG